MKFIILFILIVNINAALIRDDDTKTILDTTTLLVWQDDGDAQLTPKTWSEAITYCEDLTLDSKTDWRLPNLYELNSITDSSKYTPAIYDEFTNVTNDYYWSSTTYEYYKNYAWYINFDSSASGYAKKSVSFYTRCVRSSN